MTERKLRKLDTLFAGPGQAAPIPISQRQLKVVPHDLIDAHPKHPFKPYNAESRPGLLESVQTMGVLQPILLQAKTDGTPSWRDISACTATLRRATGRF